MAWTCELIRTMMPADTASKAPATDPDYGAFRRSSAAWTIL
jgi:hypothetical protein